MVTAIRMVFSAVVGLLTLFAAIQWMHPPPFACFMVGFIAYMFAMACTKLEVLE